ncbi:hypothetical protein C8J56DRAFT_1165544 [Mycena floridula]|nr:hypothetical protein C8J56DRAFT_1165544 [Mycena floridula]
MFRLNWLALFLAQSIRTLVQLIMISVRLFPSTTSSLMPDAYFMPLDTSSTETMTVNNDAILFTVGPRKELFRIYKKDCVLRVGAGVVWSRQRLPFLCPQYSLFLALESILIGTLQFSSNVRLIILIPTHGLKTALVDTVFVASM